MNVDENMIRRLKELNAMNSILDVLFFLEDHEEFDEDNSSTETLKDLFDRISEDGGRKYIPDHGRVLEIPKKVLVSKASKGYVLHFPTDADMEMNMVWVSERVIKKSESGSWQVWIGPKSYFIVFNQNEKEGMRVQADQFAGMIKRCGRTAKHKRNMQI